MKKILANFRQIIYTGIWRSVVQTGTAYPFDGADAGLCNLAGGKRGHDIGTDGS